MLYDDAQFGYGRGDYRCRLATALAIYLAGTGRALNDGLHDYAPLLLTPAPARNPASLSEGEAVQALYTALTTGQEFTKDHGIGPGQRRKRACRQKCCHELPAFHLVSLRPES